MINAIIDSRKFAIIKAKEKTDAWASINNGQEIAFVVEESKLKDVEVVRKEKDLRLITFDESPKISLNGFLSRISTKLAEAKIPIFVVSAFSTDHILVKDEYLESTTKQLEALYFKVI
jgi:hypothetical protein